VSEDVGVGVGGRDVDRSAGVAGERLSGGDLHAGADTGDHRGAVVGMVEVVVDDQRLGRRVGRDERHVAAALRLEHARAGREAVLLSGDQAFFAHEPGEVVGVERLEQADRLLDGVDHAGVRVVLEIEADPRQLEHGLDLERLELLAATDAGQHQELRRAVCAGAQDDLA